MVQTPLCRTDSACPRFLTLRTIDLVPVFAHPALMYILLDVLEFLQKNERLRIYAYVIMENHIHLIASSPALAREIGDFKSFTTGSVVSYLEAKNARSILTGLERFRVNGTLPLWQKGWRLERIPDAGVLRQIADRIHQNPVRKGYVDDPCHWHYSSARNYAGQPGLLDVVTEWPRLL